MELVALPFTPQPLPDEILGSLAWRSALLNALSSPKHLLPADASIRSNLIKYNGFRYSDSPEPSDLTKFFLARLGLTYDNTITMLTTRPYWTCFYQYNNFIKTRSDSIRPMTLTRGHYSIHTSRFMLRRYLQVCQICIKEDLTEHGVAYFHRSHQLLGSSCCHKHSVALMARCLNCSTPIGDVKYRVVVRLRCTCGWSILKDCAETASPELACLAKFEYSALLAKPGTLRADKLMHVVRRVRDENPKLQNRSWPKILEEFYGNEQLAWIVRDLKWPDATVPIARNWQINLHTANPLILSAICVALGLTIESAGQAISDSPATEGQISPNHPYRHLPMPSTVAEAKRRISQALKDISPMCKYQWGKLSVTSSFWLLRLREPAWLDKLLPPPSARSHRKPLPTIQADRKLLKGLAHRANSRGAKSLVYLARVRAHYRDKEWLEREIKRGQAKIDKLNKASLCTQLQRAHDTHFSLNGRPVRFKQQTAAAMLGMTTTSLSRKMDRLGIDKFSFIESPRDFKIRQIRSAYKECLADSSSITLSMVLIRAGFRTSRDLLAFARNVLNWPTVKAQQ